MCSQTDTFIYLFIRIFQFFSFIYLFIYFFDRQMSAWEGQSEKETQNLNQASVSRLSAQSSTWGSNSQTIRHHLSWGWTLNQWATGNPQTTIKVWNLRLLVQEYWGFSGWMEWDYCDNILNYFITSKWHTNIWTRFCFNAFLYWGNIDGIQIMCQALLHLERGVHRIIDFFFLPLCICIQKPERKGTRNNATELENFFNRSGVLWQGREC